MTQIYPSESSHRSQEVEVGEDGTPPAPPPEVTDAARHGHQTGQHGHSRQGHAGHDHSAMVADFRRRDEPKVWVVDQASLAPRKSIDIAGEGHQMVTLR